MKSFIYKVNQYLIERYPNIWNTRLVWMLSASLIVHVLFFVFGLATLTNPETLHDRGAEDIFFKNGSIFLSIIITILLFVVWLIYHFKNNGFKSFYPASRNRLFLQYFYYLLIAFFSSNFYLSYNYGIKTYICLAYSDEQISKDIKLSNDASLFLSQDIKDYTVDQRLYPEIFNKLYCEINEQLIDKTKPYLSFLDEDYQFYTLYTKELKTGQPYDFSKDYNNQVYTRRTDSLNTYYFKDSVANVPKDIKTATPSYYNYSDIFYRSRSSSSIEEALEFNYAYNDYENYDEYNFNYRKGYSKANVLVNKRSIEILNRNDTAEIKKLLSDFLNISKAYKIPHNLTSDDWFQLIYHPDSFEVKFFISNRKKSAFETKAAVSVNNTQFQNFFNKQTTDYYYESDSLKAVFENIEAIKASSPFWDSIHFFLWFSFFFSLLVFVFRVTGLKELLFSVILVGVLTLFIALFAALLFYLVSVNGDTPGYIISYLTLFLYLGILIVTVFYAERTKKIVVAICLNISMTGFTLFLFLVLAIISMHQRDYCQMIRPDSGFYDCKTVFDYFEINWSFILFFLGLVFLYFYMSIVKKWKSLPEA